MDTTGKVKRFDRKRHSAISIQSRYVLKNPVYRGVAEAQRTAFTCHTRVAQPPSAVALLTKGREGEYLIIFSTKRLNGQDCSGPLYSCTYTRFRACGRACSRESNN